MEDRLNGQDAGEGLELGQVRGACARVGRLGDDGEPIRNEDKAWARIIRRAGLWHEDRERRPRPHDLRRSAGAAMTAAGVPLQTVTAAIGDSPNSASMVARVYAVVGDEARRSAFRAIGEQGRKHRRKTK